MKANRFFAFLFVFAGSSILNGCASGNQITPSLVSVTATTEIMPSHTPTLEPTLTFTPVPTLSPDEAYAHLNALLTNTANCRLPCWLGITPGQSTWQEVNEQLTMFSSIAPQSLDIGTIKDKGAFGLFTVPYPNDNMIIEVGPSYQASADANEVSVVWLHSRAYKLKDGMYDGDVYGYPPYNELLKPYTLSGVLSSYGPPDQIYIVAYLGGDYMPNSPGFDDYFQIHVWYPDEGIFMAYKMSVGGIGDQYRFCPANALISANLTQPGLGAGYKDFLLQLNEDQYKSFFSPSIYVKTPDEAFGISNDEFYQLFQSPTDRCLETPKTIWWSQ